MNLSTTSSKTEATKQALECLKTLAEDISMLASGDWLPDDASCAASLDVIERARKLVIELST